MDAILRTATRLAETLNQRQRLVAILVNKKPISVATNDMFRSHPIISASHPKRRLHAEIRCLLKAPYGSPKGGTVYVVRINSKGPALAKPCPMCMEYMVEVGIKRVFYTTNKGDFKEVKL